MQCLPIPKRISNIPNFWYVSLSATGDFCGQMALSKEESLEILSLAEGASVQEIENKYNELYSDFQIRLTNAPTPNLKKLYQKNHQDLE